MKQTQTCDTAGAAALPSRFALIALSALIALLLGACGTDSGPGTGTGGGGGKLTFEQATAQMPGVFCDVLVRCKVDLGFFSFGTQAGCVSVLGSEINGDSSTAALIAAGTAVWDGTKGAACLSKLKSISCADVGTDMEQLFSQAAEECEAAVTGTVKDGATCDDSEACVSKWCKITKAGCAGTCTAPLAKDAKCAGGDHCAAGLVCRGDVCSDKLAGDVDDPCSGEAKCASTLACVGGKCAAPGKDGESCQNGGKCAAGLACAGDGKCAAAKKAGESCTKTMFGTHDCDAGLVCGGEAGKETCLATAKLGGACKSDEACFGVDTECKADKCVAILISTAVGGACRPADPAAGAYFSIGCGAGLACAADKTCKTAPKDGEACIGGSCAAGLSCAKSSKAPEGVCRGDLKEGEDCGQGSIQCGEGLACDSGKCAKPTCS